MIAVVLLTLAPLAVRAADFVVDSTVDAVDANVGDGICASASGDCTLRAAVIETNALGGSDRIDLPAGTFTLSIPGAEEDASLTGDLDITDDLEILGQGPEASVVDAAALDRVIHVVGHRDAVKLESLTLTGGYAPWGSGIYMVCRGCLSLSRAVVRGNQAAPGPAFANSAIMIDTTGDSSGRTVSIHQSRVEDNAGAGIYTAVGCSSSPTTLVLETLVSGNSGSGVVRSGESCGPLNIVRSRLERNGGWGASLQDSGPVRIEESEVIGNAQGGIIAYSDGYMSLVIAGSTVRDNDGTGIVLIDFVPSPTSISTIVDSSIANNRSSSGAGGIGISNLYSGFPITNTTVTGNSGTMGGGISINWSTFGYGESLFTNLTIASNSASETGGGLTHASNASGQSVVVLGSVVAGNSAPVGPDCAELAIPSGDPTIVSAGYNVIGDSSDCIMSTLPTDQVGTASSPVNALLGPLQDNGGPTPTRAPMTGSPLLDMGGATCVAADQRGVPRPFDGDDDGVAQCDIGAYEAADFDGDGVGDLVDNCTTTVNADQADSDGDLIGDACDNCVQVANPRVPADWLSSNDWAVLTGGQRDDDHDGYGNICDADFNNSFTTTVADTAQYKASIGRDRTTATCGTPAGFGTLPCAIFDLDEGTTTDISTADTARYKLLLGYPPGPKCPTCPLACEHGAQRSCEP